MKPNQTAVRSCLNFKTDFRMIFIYLLLLKNLSPYQLILNMASINGQRDLSLAVNSKKYDTR
jgi:hypothetical protein